MITLETSTEPRLQAWERPTWRVAPQPRRPCIAAGRDTSPATPGRTPVTPMSSQQQHDDDAADLALAATGDRAALGRLYDRHAGVMLGLARRFLAEPQDAMDLVHDVFVEAWQRANSYRPGQSAVRSWLLLRVRSRCLDRLRRSKVAATGLARMGDEIHDDTFASPCAEVEHGKLRGALQALDEPKRRVITLAYFSGLTCTEIAGRLDMPVGTVKTHLSRGIARMRKTLTEQPS